MEPGGSQDAANTKKRKRQTSKIPDQPSDTFKNQPIPLNLSPFAPTTTSSLSNTFTSSVLNLTAVYEKDAPAAKSQVAASLALFRKICKHIVEKPFRIPSVDDDEPDAILSLSKPEDAPQDAWSSPPPAKRAKKATTNVSTTNQSISESIDESLTLDSSFQKDDDPLNSSFDLGGTKSTGLGSKTSSINYKQMVLVPKRQNNTRVLRSDPEARDLGEKHRAFMQRYKISKKYRDFIASELDKVRRENPGLSFQPSPKRIRTIGSPKHTSFKPKPINYSDLTVLERVGSASAKSPSLSSSASVPKETVSTSKRKTPNTTPGAKKASGAAAKRTGKSAASRSVVPKPPPLSSKALKQSIKHDSEGAAASAHNATENDAVAASLLISLASKQSKPSVLGFSSPTKQLSITQYVSSPAQQKIPPIVIAQTGSL